MPRITSVRTRPQIVVAGGGVGGLEAVLALRSLVGRMTGIDLLTPDDEFVYRPMLVAEPFGHLHALRLPLARLERSHGVRRVRDRMAGVEPAAHRVRLEGGGTLGYDVLIIATGARQLPWLDGAVTFGGPAAVERVEALLASLGDGTVGRLLLTAPDAGWTLPMYELALLTATWCA